MFFVFLFLKIEWTCTESLNYIHKLPHIYLGTFRVSNHDNHFKNIPYIQVLLKIFYILCFVTLFTSTNKIIKATMFKNIFSHLLKDFKTIFYYSKYRKTSFLIGLILYFSFWTVSIDYLLIQGFQISDSDSKMQRERIENDGFWREFLHTEISL